MIDHYETLGVAIDASADELKQSYRKLAMEWHPDRHKGDKTAEEKFKVINEAYDTLSDDNKRRLYDQQRGRGQGGPDPFGGFNNPMDDILNHVFNQHFAFRGARPVNRDINMGMNISLEDAYIGKQIPVQFSTPSGKQIELIINIPSGVESGIRIRYQGQGDHSNTSLPPGDLFIIINIIEHAMFRREGTTIESLLKIDAITAIIGGKIKTTCIDGSTVEVLIPSGTQPYSKLRISGKGMPLHTGYKGCGDMLLIIEIKIPTDLSIGQIDELKKIQSLRGLDNT